MGILQARILEWVVFPFSRGSSPTQGSNPGLPHCRWILMWRRKQRAQSSRDQPLTGRMWQNGDSNLHLLIQVHTPFLLTLCRALHYVLGIQKWWWHALSKWSMNSEKAGANKINYTNTAWVRKLIFLSSSSPHSYSLHNLIGWAEHPSFPFHSLIDSFIYWSILPFIHEFIGFFSNHTNTSLFMGSLPQARQYCCCVYAIVGSPVQYVSRIEGDVYAHTHLSPCTFAEQTDGKMNKGCEEGICRKCRREKHKKMPSPHSRFIAILPNARAALGIRNQHFLIHSHFPSQLNENLLFWPSISFLLLLVSTQIWVNMTRSAPEELWRI